MKDAVRVMIVTTLCYDDGFREVRYDLFDTEGTCITVSMEEMKQLKELMNRVIEKEKKR